MTDAKRPDALTQIRHAVLECLPEPDYDGQHGADYNTGWHECYRMFERVLVAVEAGLICRKCGAPAHRGPDAATLNALLAKGDNETTDQPVDVRGGQRSESPT